MSYERSKNGTSYSFARLSIKKVAVGIRTGQPGVSIMWLGGILYCVSAV